MAGLYRVPCHGRLGLGLWCRGQQQLTELSEPEKVDLRVAVQFRRQTVEIFQTIFHDGDPPVIEPLGAIEVEDHAAADHRIKRHQLALIWT